MDISDIDEQEVKNFKSLLEFLKRLSDDGITPLIEKQVILMLGHSLKFFSHLVMEDRFPEIQRLTINNRVLNENTRIRKIEHLKYPPTEFVKSYGRCNQPGESVLYAAFHKMTVLNELKPKIGDLITTSIWRAKENEKLKFCPIFRNQPFKNDILNPRTFEINNEFEKLIVNYPKNIKEQIIDLVDFVADSFSKTITSKNHLEYIFSAYFSSKIFNDFEEGSIEAIYYPSVQDHLSFENIAIKPTVFDNKYELYEVKDSVVIVDPRNGKGGYLMEGLSDCKKFDYSSGKILWDPHKVYQPKERIEKLTKQFNIKLD